MKVKFFKVGVSGDPYNPLWETENINVVPTGHLTYRTTTYRIISEPVFRFDFDGNLNFVELSIIEDHYHKDV